MTDSPILMPTGGEPENLDPIGMLNARLTVADNTILSLRRELEMAGFDIVQWKKMACALVRRLGGEVKVPESFLDETGRMNLRMSRFTEPQASWTAEQKAEAAKDKIERPYVRLTVSTKEKMPIPEEKPKENGAASKIILPPGVEA